VRVLGAYSNDRGIQTFIKSVEKRHCERQLQGQSCSICALIASTRRFGQAFESLFNCCQNEHGPVGVQIVLQIAVSRKIKKYRQIAVQKSGV
jgi:hypothetical protein